jgi:2-polyprenyl-3-methyl-5-hydroxy-6-metoxy-1,4-benzoquinol methylase
MTDPTAGTTAQVRQPIDAKAATWASKYAPDGRLAGRLIWLADAGANYSVLDLGCCTGDLASLIAAGGMRVTGRDISPEALRHATTTHSSGNIDCAQLGPGWQELPFRPETLDEVVASSVLEYVDDPCTVLHECHRTVRPGAAVLCTVPNPRNPVRSLKWLGSLAREPVVRMTSRRWPRLHGYLTYLLVWRQRHLTR